MNKDNEINANDGDEGIWFNDNSSNSGKRGLPEEEEDEDVFPVIVVSAASTTTTTAATAAPRRPVKRNKNKQQSPPPPLPPKPVPVVAAAEVQQQQQQEEQVEEDGEDDDEDEDENRGLVKLLSNQSNLDLNSVDDLREAFKAQLVINKALNARLMILERSQKHMMRVMGVTNKVQKSKSYTGVEALKFTPGYEPKRSITEIQFRNEDGTARYPGMDKFIPPAKVSKGGKRRKCVDSAALEHVMIGRSPSEYEILSVPYYTLAEQVKHNTELLNRINSSILPVLERHATVNSAVAMHLLPEAPIIPPATLRSPASAAVTDPLLVFPVVKAPHLNVMNKGDGIVQGAVNPRNAKRFPAKRAADIEAERAIAEFNDRKQSMEPSLAAAAEMNAKLISENVRGGGGGSDVPAPVSDTYQTAFMSIQDQLKAVTARLQLVESLAIYTQPPFSQHQQPSTGLFDDPENFLGF